MAKKLGFDIKVKTMARKIIIRSNNPDISKVDFAYEISKSLCDLTTEHHSVYATGEFFTVCRNYKSKHDLPMTEELMAGSLRNWTIFYE